MSINRDMEYWVEEEEEMVRRLGGRGRGLVQALLRVRRERAGRTPQNCQIGQDNRMRPRQGGRSMWSGSGEGTGRASGMGETIWNFGQCPRDSRHG